MEQLVARRAHNPKVVGSSPAPLLRKPKYESIWAFLFSGLVRFYVTNQVTTSKFQIKVTKRVTTCHEEDQINFFE